jgi:hypothetical protein
MGFGYQDVHIFTAVFNLTGSASAGWNEGYTLASFAPRGDASGYSDIACTYKLAAPTSLTAGLERSISSRSGAEWTQHALTQHAPENLSLQADPPDDLTPPVTSLDSTPCLPTSEASATFLFTATDPYSGSGVNHFECSLDGADFADCVSGISYTGLAVGDHTFDVRAVDNASNTGAPVHFTWTVEPLPRLASLAPTSVAAGSPAFTLILNGANFVDGATAQWNGSDLPTTYVSPTQLPADIQAEKIVSAGVAYITVTDPGTPVSNPLAFYITQNPAPVTASDVASGENPSASTGTESGVTASATGSGTLSVAQYDSNPGGPTAFQSSGGYMDVRLAPDHTFTTLSIVNCDLKGGKRIYWWNGTAWALASNQAYDNATGCVTIDVTASRLTLLQTPRPAWPTSPARSSPQATKQTRRSPLKRSTTRRMATPTSPSARRAAAPVSEYSSEELLPLVSSHHSPTLGGRDRPIRWRCCPSNGAVH